MGQTWSLIRLHLLGRAFDRAIRAKHTAVPRLGPQQRAAAFTPIHKLAVVGGHGLNFLKSAGGAGQRRLQDNFRHRLDPPSPTSHETDRCRPP